MNVAEETLGFRRASLSLALSLLMSAFALPIPPASLSRHLQRPTERSPTMWQLNQTPALRACSTCSKQVGPPCRTMIGRTDQRLDFIGERFSSGRACALNFA